MTRFLYSVLWYLATPLLAGYLLYRSWRQPEYRSYWPQRWGLAYPKRGTAPLIWVHAVSVGETRAATPLVRSLLDRYPDHEILFSHTTPTGRAASEELFSSETRVHRCYLPYDYPGASARFLRHFTPRIGLLMETEIWPNLLAAANQDQGIPVLLVNGRLSEKSLLKAVKHIDLIQPALRYLRDVLVQTSAHQKRFGQLGIDSKVLGNIKFDQALDQEKQTLGLCWRALIDKRIVLLASSREGEELQLLKAIRELKNVDPQFDQGRLGAIRFLIVPRHPQRVEKVSEEIQAFGYQVNRRSASDWLNAVDENTILLGDSMGEMASYYSMSSVCLMGGSFGGTGGQNHIEACAYGCPVVLGPSTYNFEDAAEDAIADGAAQRAIDMEQALEIALGWDPLPDAIAREFSKKNKGALERTLQVIRPYLDK